MKMVLSFLWCLFSWILFGVLAVLATAAVFTYVEFFYFLLAIAAVLVVTNAIAFFFNYKTKRINK